MGMMPPGQRPMMGPPGPQGPQGPPNPRDPRQGWAAFQGGGY
jgi:hypothetical protein